jgi:acetyltransferase
LADGTDVVIRPIRPEDVWLVQDFVRNLSEESRYFRFMKSVEQLSETLLVRLTQIDYSREMALIAIRNVNDKEVELGVTRYAINPDGESCEFALVVADNMRGTGLGHKLMTTLINIARSKGLKRIEGEVLKNNSSMLKLMKRLSFSAKTNEDDTNIKDVYLDL